MRVPTRKSDQYKKRDSGPIYLTSEALEKLKRKLKRLESALPVAIAEVERTKEYGDFSENEEYKAAKRKMRAIHYKIAELKSSIARSTVINKNRTSSNEIQIGSTVTIVDSDGNEKTYKILDSIESNPSKGVISYKSPLGMSLMGKKTGDNVRAGIRNTRYKIIKIE